MPERIVRFSGSAHGFDGVLVIDSTILGPGSGGIRMLSDIDEPEVRLLARTMTVKNALSGIPAGGAKAGIKADPNSMSKREALIRFAEAVAPLIRSMQYVPSPDMGTSEDEVLMLYARANAVPLLRNSILFRERSHIPLARIMTAIGVVEAALVGARVSGLKLESHTVAIEGFGRVGSIIAYYFARKGFKVIAISTASAMISSNRGLNVVKLIELREKFGDNALIEYAKADAGVAVANPSCIVSAGAEILVPSARPFIINRTNAEQVNSKMIVPSANNPVSLEAEQILFDRGILSVPDFISNSGGVIAGMVSRLGGDEAKMLLTVRRIIRGNVKKILGASFRTRQIPRMVGLQIAAERLLKAEKCKAMKCVYFSEDWINLLMTPTALENAIWHVTRRSNY